MNRYIYPLFLGLFLFQTVSYAETIRGMIINLDPSNNILIVKRIDTPKTGPLQLNVRVKEDTTTKNVPTLKDLKIGHEVKIDARENKPEGLFEAKAIEVTNAKPPQATSA